MSKFQRKYSAFYNTYYCLSTLKKKIKNMIETCVNIINISFNFHINSTYQYGSQ